MGDIVRSTLDLPEVRSVLGCCPRSPTCPIMWRYGLMTRYWRE